MHCLLASYKGQTVNLFRNEHILKPEEQLTSRRIGIQNSTVILFDTEKKNLK